VSTPFNLALAAHRLDRGWNKLIYTRHFLKTLRRKALAKVSAHGLDLDPHALRAAATFREYDDVYTAPVHGFKDAEDYWTQSSCMPWLQSIEVPTLLINARNDPFYPGDALPTRAEVSDAVSLEYPATGGHVGFVSGGFPGRFEWLSGRILNFFRAESF
jgi:predicted alpha/beta-fold hydrolase